MVKKLLIFGILIGILVASYFTLYFFDVSGEILEVRGNNIFIYSIEVRDHLKEDLIQRGISPEQATDIVKHPNKYRRVAFTFRFHNHSVWAAVADIQMEAHLPQDARKRLVWMEHNIMRSYVDSGEKDRPDSLSMIFKLEEGDTEEDLMEICKQVRFTVTGKKFGFFDHGSISVPVHFSGD